MFGRKVASPVWLLFFLPVLLSASISPDPWLSIMGRYNAYSWGIISISLCVILFYSDMDFIAPTGLILSLYAYYEYFAGLTRYAGNRVMSLIGSPVDLGVVLAVCALVALQSKSRWRVAQALVMLPAIYLTGTRSAWLGLLIGFIGFSYLFRQKYLYTILTISVTVGGILLVLHPRPVADGARIEVWKAAIKTIKEAPLLGHGPDSFEDAFKRHRSKKFMDIMGNTNGANRSQADPHNSILAILSFFGAVGLATFLAFFYCVGFTPPLLALFVASMFNPVSVETIALGALLAGRQVRRESQSRLMAGAFLLLSLVCVYNICAMVKADYWYQRGNIAKALGIEEYPFYLEATKNNPTEPVYAAALINSIRGRDHNLALEAVNNLGQYRTCADVQSFRGMVLRGAKDKGALKHIKAALALDPLNPMLLAARREFQ